MEHVTNFIMGMDKDSSDEFIQPQSYRHLENGDITAAVGEGTGVLTNVNGNSQLTIVWPSDVNPLLAPYSGDAKNPFGANYELVKNVPIGKDIVQFYAHVSPANDYTIISILKYNSLGTYTRIIITGDKMNAVTPTYVLDIGIQATTELITAAVYEHAGLIKVYFSDKDLTKTDLNQLHYVNVAPDIANGVVKDAFLQASYREYDTMPVNGMGALGKKELANDLLAPVAYPLTGGGLRSGAYQYAFRYGKNGGNKTVWSDLSDMVYLTTGDISHTTRELKGSVSVGSLSSGKQIAIDLTANTANIIDDYDFIEVARLWFNAVGATPACYIIKRVDAPTTTNILYDSDYAEVIEVVSVSEFTNIATLYSMKAIAPKDDRMFAANIKEDSFDINFDARVFRFTAAASPPIVSVVTQEDGSGSKTVRASDLALDIATIPLDHDLVNPSNILANDFTPALNGYKFQSDGTTLGAEGLNVKVSFTLTMTDIDNLDLPGYHGKDLTTARELGYITTCQLDEIYRLGVVFEDDYGRVTPVKYIGDIRVPTHYELYGSFRTLRDQAGKVDIVVTITKAGTEADGLRHRIVMVPREANDRTVLSQGLVTPIIHPTFVDIDYCGTPFLSDEYETDDDGLGTPKANPLYASNNNLGTTNPMAIVSPEVLFNQNTNFNGCRLDFLGWVNPYYDKWWKDRDSAEIVVPILFKHARIKSFEFYTPNVANNSGDIGDNKLVMSGSFGVVNNILINPMTVHISHADSQELHRWYGQPCTTHYMHVTGFALAGTADNQIAFCNVRKDITQYGGRSYQARLNNIYVPFKGDTFISLFEYQSIQRPNTDLDDPVDPLATPFWHRIAETIVIPVESSINLHYRYDDTFNNLSNGSALGCEAMQVREEGRTTIHICNTEAWYKTLLGVDTYIGIEQVTAIKYISWTPLYKIMSAYNVIDNTQKYAMVKDDYLRDEIKRSRVRYSELKTYGELYDNWLDFKPLNFRDLDPIYGEVNFLKNFRDEIYAFQERAFSMLVINPTVQMQADDGTNMIMGTGQVLHDVKYLTTDIGIQNNNEAYESLSYLYWIDNYKKKLYQFGNGVQSLGDIAKISSWLSNTLTLTTKFLGTYDFANKTMLLSMVNYIGGSIDRNHFTVTASAAGAITLTGDADYLQLREGNKIDISTITGTYPGVYEVDWVSSTAVRLLRLSGTSVPLAGIVDMSLYLKYRSSYTLKFDEMLQLFKGFDPFIPIHLFRTALNVISVPEDSAVVWTHNTGDKGKFYGTTYPMIVDFVANEARGINKSFGALEIDNDAILDNKDYESDLNYTGVENVTFNKVRVIGNRNMTEYIDLYTKDAKIVDEVIGVIPYTTNTGDIASSNYAPGVTRTLLDTNGVKHTVFPNYLYNVRQTLNKFLLTLPRIKHGTVDSYSRPRTELVRGTSSTIRLVYNNLTQATLRVRNIITHFNTSINA